MKRLLSLIAVHVYQLTQSHSFFSLKLAVHNSGTKDLCRVSCRMICAFGCTLSREFEFESAMEVKEPIRSRQLLDGNGLDDAM